MAIFKIEKPSLSQNGGETDSERISRLERYVYELVDLLEYVLSHIDSDNFNESGLGEIADRLGEISGGDKK